MSTFVRLPKVEAMAQGPEDGSFVYFLHLGDEVVYVGQTRNLRRRIKEHWRKRFDSVSWMPDVPIDQRLALERRFIRAHEPKHNGQRGRPRSEHPKRKRFIFVDDREWYAWGQLAAELGTTRPELIRLWCGRGAKMAAKRLSKRGGKRE